VSIAHDWPEERLTADPGVGHDPGALFTNFCVQRKLSAHIEGEIPYVSSFRVISCFCLLLAAMPGALSVTGLAQSMLLDLPLQSQRAEVSQRIGITDITINYHRPLVNERKCGAVWFPMARCGGRERI